MSYSWNIYKASCQESQKFTSAVGNVSVWGGYKTYGYMPSADVITCYCTPEANIALVLDTVFRCFRAQHVAERKQQVLGVTESASQL